VLARGAAAIAVATAGLLAIASPASADEMTVEAGVDGFYDPGEHVVVRVTVRADRLLRGEIRVAVPNAGRTIVVRQPVEVPGGAEKTYLMPCPTSPFDSGNLTIELVPDGGEPLRRTVNLEATTDTDLVGVLPALAAAAGQLPGTTSLAVDAGTARLSVLDAETLALGADAIGSYDVVAALGRDLDQLDAVARGALLDWVAHGGRLLLDDEVEPATLPVEWRPGAAGYAFAGIGEVRRTSGAAARGAWSTILEPGASNAGLNNPTIARAALENQIPPSATLARASGVDLPSIGLALMIILGYIAVVGPVLYMVLRLRRRLTLAWVGVPVVALLTAGLVVVTGNQLRTGIEPMAAGVVETWPGGARALVNVLVASRDGGSAGADLPDGWTILRGEDFGSGRMTQLLGDGAGTAFVDLDPGQATMLSVSGPVASAQGSAALAISARSVEDGEATGSVRNESMVTMRDVAVFVANAAVYVGDLVPGQEVPWTARGTDRFEVVPLFPIVWGDADFGFGFGFGGPVAAPATTNVDLGTWGLWAAQRRSALRQSGLARAVGWTSELPQPVETADGDPLDGRLAITSVVPVEATGQRVTDVSVRGSLVRAPSAALNGPAETDRIVVRYVLPPSIGGQPVPPDTPLGLMIPNWSADAEAWDGTQWVALDGRVVQPNGEWKPLPPGAVQAGVVHVRIRIRFDRDFTGTDLVLRVAPGALG
jgi:hypothetical protein